MHAASREAMAAAKERLDAVLASDGTDAAAGLADELLGVAAVLDRERALRRALADNAAEEADRAGLAHQLLADKVSAAAMQIVEELVSSRWSRPADLVEATQSLGRHAGLAAAEQAGDLDSVEDDLFRFGRILDAQPRLAGLLADRSAAVDGRLALLHEVLADRVGAITLRLLDDVVVTGHGGGLDRDVEALSVLAAQRRDRYVAHVSAAAPLEPEQEERLAASLGRIYGREIAVQVSLDPDLLGGLVVRVGDEVIDGSTAHLLAEAGRPFDS